MATEYQVSVRRRRVGLVVTAIPVLFLVFDIAIKLVEIQPVIDSFAALGYKPTLGPAIGTLLLVCLVIYLIPQSSVLGAILLTGYLGGAVATHVRVEDPLFSHTLFPVYLALFLWGGLYLRDARLRALLPWRSRD